MLLQLLFKLMPIKCYSIGVQEHCINHLSQFLNIHLSFYDHEKQSIAELPKKSLWTAVKSQCVLYFLYYMAFSKPAYLGLCSGLSSFCRSNSDETLKFLYIITYIPFLSYHTLPDPNSIYLKVERQKLKKAVFL